MPKNIDYFTGTLRECQDYIKKMNTLMGYPHGKTLTYANPLQHAKLTTVYMVPIKPVHAPRLGRAVFISDIDKASTITERTTKRKTRETLKLEGAFDRKGI